MTTTIKFPTDDPLNPRKRAVVVGASSGIGEEMARKLAEEGYLVALLARRKDKLDTICESINTQYGETRAGAYVHDVTDYADVPKLFQTILADLSRIDLFVFNSGTLQRMELSEFDFEKDQKMIAVNLLGAMAWLGQAAVLFESMGSGQMVGISSVAADRGRVGNPGYNASKAGMTTYLEGLRNRLTRHGVHVLTVKPGFVDTILMVGGKTTLGMISTEKAVKDIYKAIRGRKQYMYTPWWWRWVMLGIRHTPSVIFRRLTF